MDEYIGLNPKAPQCFSKFLKIYVFDLKPFKTVNCINPGAEDAAEECERYAELLKKNPPDIMAAEYNFCVVPAPTKAEAVKRTICGEISEQCPATILRKKDNAVMYCDNDSSRLLREEIKWDWG